MNYWNNWLNINRFDFLKLVNKKKKYYSLDISRFYFKYKDKSKIPKYISNLKKLWNNRDIIFVEGEHSRCGYKNDLFDNAKSLKRIICPSFNAFEIYDKILSSVLKIDKDKLILIALGPTASVLAYDLSKNGYQAIDIGHADVEYEWYLRKFTLEKKIIINHKFIVGLNNIKDVENFTDEKYNNQIIDKILF